MNHLEKTKCIYNKQNVVQMDNQIDDMGKVQNGHKYTENVLLMLQSCMSLIKHYSNAIWHTNSTFLFMHSSKYKVEYFGLRNNVMCLVRNNRACL